VAAVPCSPENLRLSASFAGVTGGTVTTRTVDGGYATR
jgi:hypothetical protein